MNRNFDKDLLENLNENLNDNNFDENSIKVSYFDDQQSEPEFDELFMDLDGNFFNGENSGSRSIRRSDRIFSLCSVNIVKINFNELEPEYEHHPSHFKNITCKLLNFTLNQIKLHLSR